MPALHHLGKKHHDCKQARKCRKEQDNGLHHHNPHLRIQSNASTRLLTRPKVARLRLYVTSERSYQVLSRHSTRLHLFSAYYFDTGPRQTTFSVTSSHQFLTEYYPARCILRRQAVFLVVTGAYHARGCGAVAHDTGRAAVITVSSSFPRQCPVYGYPKADVRRPFCAQYYRLLIKAASKPNHHLPPVRAFATPTSCILSRTETSGKSLLHTPSRSCRPWMQST